MLSFDSLSKNKGVSLKVHTVDSGHGHLSSSTAEDKVKKPLGGDWRPPRLALGAEDPLNEDAALPFSTVDEVSHCAVIFKLP